MSDKDLSWDNQSLVFDETEQQIKEPSMYKVLIINDDFTPMDFVIDVLVRFFRMNEERATQVMMHVHTRGKGLCGIFTHEIAETKMMQVNQYAKDNSHPLLCVMELV
ncbi:MAG TPA: ATP-dependent Clp protease adapter ClpS [Oceanospirillales bacterium]|nr:ATP-dependent Clp protease adapter ClpS [Oceanospirillales bacterium]